jgi:hypothetical protein
MNLLRGVSGVLLAAALLLLAAALIRPATALCKGGYYTDCHNNFPGCRSGFQDGGGTCRFAYPVGADPDCPSTCGWAWVSKA